MKEIQADIIVLGGGASGLFVAGQIPEEKGRVIVLEHNQKLGRKIQISGGGRCNFTNIHSTPQWFLSQNPHFCRSALARYTPQDFIDLVEAFGIEYYEKHLGQLFCRKSANQIISMLEQICRSRSVEIFLDQKDLEVSQSENQFRIFNNQVVYSAPKLIVATGGLSVPKIGATDLGFRIAKSFGHKIIPPRPALVGLRPGPDPTLSGISQVASVRIRDKVTCEPILCTHKSLSGPAMLKTSLWWEPGDEIAIGWTPNLEYDEVKKNIKGKTQLAQLFKGHLPKELFRYLVPERLTSINPSQLNKKQWQEIYQCIWDYRFTPTGTDGMRKAEATKGGICTESVDSKSMGSKLCQGLYFIGEVLDVTGQLGGHNFQWAWASAHACASEI